MDIYEEILEARKKNRPYALATVVRTIGCTPRPAGTKMIVYADGTSNGTVGGGMAERLVIQDAVSAIKSGQPFLKRYSPQVLKEQDLEPDCEKVIDVFIEPGERRPHLYLFGSGHVAQSILHYAKKLNYYVGIIDVHDVSDYADALEEADEIIRIDSFDSFGAFEPAPQSFFLIAAGSHEDDGKALGLALRANAAYIGMLGAKHKFVPIYKRLREQGYTDETLKEIYAPAGLDIGGRTLPEIAVSVIAEIQAVRYGRTGVPMRDRKRGEIFGE